MQKEEQETFELLIEAINKVQEFKNILVKTKQFQLAGSLRDFEKEVHQAMSDFFNTKKKYTEDDLRKAFLAARSGVSTSAEHADNLKASSPYPTFESWFNSDALKYVTLDAVINEYLCAKDTQIKGQ